MIKGYKKDSKPKAIESKIKTPEERFLAGYNRLVKETNCSWSFHPVFVLRDDQSWSVVIQQKIIRVQPSPQNPLPQNP